MMLAAAEDFRGNRSRGLGRNDLYLLPTTALVRFTPSAEGGPTATLVFENVPFPSKLSGWTVQPFSSSTEVHLLSNL